MYIVKRYADGRFYDPQKKKYLRREALARMLAGRKKIQVIQSKSGQDVTREIAIELELMDATVQELLALQRDAAERVLTVREKTAAAAFLAQFYNGVENIFKRISRFHGVPLPTGATWHVDLFKERMTGNPR